MTVAAGGVRVLTALSAAVAAGAALWAAHPPLGSSVSAWLVAPLLVTALRIAGGGHPLDPGAVPPSRRTALLLGTTAGSAGYGAMLVWISYEAGAAAWILLTLIQALWLGLWSVLLLPRLGSRFLPLHGAILWVGIEWLRTRWPLGGFAWGRLAYAQVDVGWLTPTGRVLGASGMTLVVVIVGLGLLQSLLSLRLDRESPSRPALLQLLVPVLAVTLVTVGPPATSGSLDVLAVQGNDIRHWERPVADAPLTITRNHHDLTLEAVARDGRPDVTVWAESSLDRDPSRANGAPLWELAGRAAGAAGTLVAGASLDGPDPATQRTIGAVVLGPDGETDRYVKRRPVPFGEYVPARAVLGRLPALDRVPRDAVPGPGPASVEVAPGVRAAIAYCFESLFPAIVRSNVLAGGQPAALLFTMTNDAAFRDGAQPEQHLAQSRLRAIETGRWTVHVAISGITAVVDQDGRVLERTEPFTLATIRRDVPLAVGLTPYLRLGDLVGTLGALSVAAAAAAAALGSLSGRRRRRGPRPRRPAA